MKRFGLVLCIAVFVFLISACSSQSAGMVDGYYTAEMAEFDVHGWKEFLTIYVKDNKIVSADYEAKNPSGFIKSWDMNYMRVMNAQCGTYPNEYVRLYSEALLNHQNAESIHAITGATHSYYTFKVLANAAIDLAMSGEEAVAFVETAPENR